MRPRAEQSPIFEDIFAGQWRFGGWEWLVNLALLACVLRATTEKRSSLFFEEKSAPRTEKPGYAYTTTATATITTVTTAPSDLLFERLINLHLHYTIYKAPSVEKGVYNVYAQSTLIN